MCFTCEWSSSSVQARCCLRKLKRQELAVATWEAEVRRMPEPRPSKGTWRGESDFFSCFFLRQGFSAAFFRDRIFNMKERDTSFNSLFFPWNTWYMYTQYLWSKNLRSTTKNYIEMLLKYLYAPSPIWQRYMPDSQELYGTYIQTQKRMRHVIA